MYRYATYIESARWRRGATGDPGKAGDNGTPEQLTWYARDILKLSGWPPKNLLLLNMLAIA